MQTKRHREQQRARRLMSERTNHERRNKKQANSNDAAQAECTSNLRIDDAMAAAIARS
jgi:hypothetical protein